MPSVPTKDIIDLNNAGLDTMPKRILVIDDNHEGQPFYEALRGFEAEVEMAHNPIAAYPKLWRTNYDILVARVGLDPAKQEEMLKVLWQARRSNSKTEIIMVTDFCSQELAQHAQELEVAFCLKADTEASLLEKILLGLALRYRRLPADGIADNGMERALDGFPG